MVAIFSRRFALHFRLVVRCGFSFIYSLRRSACTWPFFILSASLGFSRVMVGRAIWLTARVRIVLPRMQCFAIIARQKVFPGNAVRKVYVNVKVLSRHVERFLRFVK